MMPKHFLDAEGEPEATCRHCEYFDGGGLGADMVPVHFEGDCSNTRSPVFQTNQDNTCWQFFPCSTRWPEPDHD